MKLYLVRHGETYLNKYKRMQGWSDTPLTENGKEMAYRCGQHLKQFPISHMITSDLGRTIETGEIIASVLKLDTPISRLSAFRETFFGSYEGADGRETWDEVARKSGFANVGELYRNAGLSDIMDYFHKADETGDAEDYQTFIGRIKEGLDTIQQTYDENDHIVLVTHGNTIRNIACLVDPTVNPAEDLVNAGISILELKDSERILLSYNIKPND